MKERTCDYCKASGPMSETLIWSGIDDDQWCEQIDCLCLACGEFQMVWDYSPAGPVPAPV